MRIRVYFDPDCSSESADATVIEHAAPAGVDVVSSGIGRELPHRGADEVDLALFLSWDTFRKAQRASPPAKASTAPVAIRWPEPWPCRLPEFHEAYRAADAVLFQHRTYWEMLGRLPRTGHCGFAIDRRVFRVENPVRSRVPRVLWLAFDERRKRRVYQRFMVDAGTFLEQLDIAYEVVLREASPAERARQFNAGTLLLCTESDPATDRLMLEAAACGCVPIWTENATVPSLFLDGRTGHRVAPQDAALAGRIPVASRTYLQFAARLQAEGEKERELDLFAALQRLREPSPDSDSETLDLSASVTVFVTTVGAPSYQACLDHLKLQDCKFLLRVIDRVAPMSAAFQAMLDQCSTPYYVQVDEDMLLYPGAVRRLCECLRKTPPRVALAVAWLHDVHQRRHIQGVKIFKHDIVRRFPLEDVRSCELQQIARLREQGYDYAVVQEDAAAPEATPRVILGLHGTHPTARSTYERYLTLELARHKNPFQHDFLEDWPAIFLHRFLDSGDELDYFALMGLIAGRLAPPDGEGREKDYRTYDAILGFEKAREFLERFSLSDRSPRGGGLKC